MQQLNLPSFVLRSAQFPTESLFLSQLLCFQVFHGALGRRCCLLGGYHTLTKGLLTASQLEPQRALAPLEVF